MTDGVTTSLNVRLTAANNKTPQVGSEQQAISELFTLSLVPGTGAGKSDLMYGKALNIAASGSTTIDLSGSLTDFSGATILFADIQVVYLVADETNANNIVLGGAASNQWQGPFDAVTDTVSVKPGGILCLGDPAGWPVTGGTGDQLKIANSGSGSAVTGTLVLIGRSA